MIVLFSIRQSRRFDPCTVNARRTPSSALLYHRFASEHQTGIRDQHLPAFHCCDGCACADLRYPLVHHAAQPRSFLLADLIVVVVMGRHALLVKFGVLRMAILAPVPCFDRIEAFLRGTEQCPRWRDLSVVFDGEGEGGIGRVFRDEFLKFGIVDPRLPDPAAIGGGVCELIDASQQNADRVLVLARKVVLWRGIRPSRLAELV
mmetsp:Transcript_17583/g.48790  ORF Transcript_17583/g.48790 Transcript_17583/m.48790 type:complete len:204 (-) Transcript_17583:254-865(-)